MNAPPVLDPSAPHRIMRVGGADLLRMMVGLYVEHGPDRLGLIEDGVARGDAGQVEPAAHTLKSSAGNLGAVRLQSSAASLEAAAARGVVDAGLAARIRREYEDSAAALQHMLEEHGK
jgi:HPt (histidine-containing phosphotransfer) domain-containing protein